MFRPSSGAEQYPASDGAVITHRYAGYVRDYHLCGHRSGIVLRQIAHDMRR